MKTKSILTALALVFATFGLTACNTMNGAGKDVERAGEKMQDAAK